MKFTSTGADEILQAKIAPMTKAPPTMIPTISRTTRPNRLTMAERLCGWGNRAP
jgi:hypothetical protein